MRPILQASLLLLCACDAREAPSERDVARAALVFEQALDAQRDERNLDAVLLLDEVLALDPDHAPAHRARMVVAERASRGAEVIASANWLLEHVEDDAERADALARIARVALAEGDLAETRRALTRLDDVEPDVARTALLWARYFLERGDLVPAERHARRAVKLEPWQASAHHVIGLAREADGALEEAQKSFREALRFDPGHLGARDHLATLLLRTGRAEEAVEHRRIHSALVAATPAGFRSLPPDTRIHSFSGLVELLPAWQLGHMELARALSEAGRLEEARARMETALALAPNGPDANALMAEILRQLGDEAGAQRHLEVSRASDALGSAPQPDGQRGGAREEVRE